MSMDIEAAKVSAIILQSRRFISPFSEPYGYYIWGLKDEENRKDEKELEEGMVKLYLDKLKYAVANADRLTDQAFHEFQSEIALPKEKWRELVFETFTLDAEHEEIACCLSNSDFMFGHFIECRWDSNWKLIYAWYC